MKTKVCRKCLQDIDINNFIKDKNSRDWLQSWCRDCKNKQKILYYRTKEWLIKSIFRSQKRISRERWHEQPKYTLSELLEWILKQDVFNDIFNNWEKNNYHKDYVPSCDRLNDYKWYSLDNIQITTFRCNYLKYCSDAKLWINNKRNRAVKQYTRDWIFIKQHYSLSEAHRSTWVCMSVIRNSILNKKTINSKFIWVIV